LKILILILLRNYTKTEIIRIHITYSSNSELLKKFERIRFNINESLNFVNRNTFFNNRRSDDIDVNNENGTFLIHQMNKNNNLDMAKLIIYKANEKNIILNMNHTDVFDDYPFLWAIIKNNSELVCLIMNYTNRNNIILELNIKNVTGNSPLLVAVSNNNMSIVHSIIEYANKHEIILELNKNNDNENYPY